MQDASAVEVLEARDDLFEVITHFRLRQRVSRLPNVCQRLQRQSNEYVSVNPTSVTGTVQHCCTHTLSHSNSIRLDGAVIQVGVWDFTSTFIKAVGSAYLNLYRLKSILQL